MLGGYSLGSLGGTPHDVAVRRPDRQQSGAPRFPDEYSVSPAMPSPVLPAREETVPPAPHSRAGIFGRGGGGAGGNVATVGQRPTKVAREPRFAEASEARPSILKAASRLVRAHVPMRA